MDVETAARFISSLTKSLQAVLHGCLDFEKDIELGGYIYLRVDSSEKMDYVLNERMQKNDVNSLTFLSNSFRAIPQVSSDHNKSSKEGSISCSKEQTGHSDQNTNTGSDRTVENSRPSGFHIEATSSHSHPPQQHISSREHSTSSADFSPTAVKFLHSPRVATASNDQGVKSFHGVPRSSADTVHSLTDFQTAFHSRQTSQPHSVSSHVQQPSLQNAPFSQEDRGNAGLASSQQQLGKGGLLPDAGDMEVVFIKTEAEDEVFNIPLNTAAEDINIADDLTVRRKPSWLSAGTRRPFYLPYPRLARSQSWDRWLAQAGSYPMSPLHLNEASENYKYCCKDCGKGYHSRQGLIFHERIKHQNVYSVHCPVCGKGFQQASHMDGHMAIHTNIKNFQCQVCGAKYAHKTSLQQHLRNGSCRPSQGVGHSQGKELSVQHQVTDRPQATSSVEQRHEHSPGQNHSVHPQPRPRHEEDPVVQESKECINLSVNFSKAADTDVAEEERQQATAHDEALPQFDNNTDNSNRIC